MTGPRSVLLLLFAVLPACLDASSPPEVGRAEQEANVNVVWTNLVGVQTTGAGNGLQKTASQNSWNAGASSVQTIGGHGWVRFGVATGETNTFRMLGLSTVADGDDDQDITDIDYGIMLTQTGGVSIYEDGSLVTTAGSYVDTDTFYVEATPSEIIYRKNAPPNEEILHTTSIDASIFPLQVDTSLKTASPAATIGNVVINEDPKIHVGVQQHLLADAPRCGVGDTIVLNESHFEPIDPGACSSSQDFSTWAAVDPHDIEDNLETYAGTISLDVDRDDIIVTLDLEHPGADNIWGCKPTTGPDVYYSSAQKDDIIVGLKKRIIGTRLAFPNAKLALFPSVVPHAQGTWTTRFQAQVDAIEAAADATEGLFDDLAWAQTPDECTNDVCPGLDYFLPVLFTRFGCDGVGSCDGDWGSTTVTAYTEQAIDASDEIGSGLPVLPFLSARVKGSSPFDDDLILDLGVGSETALDETLRVSLPLLKDAGVDDVVLWIGNNPDETLFEPNDGPTDNCVVGTSGTCWTVDDYTCSL